VTAVQVVWSSRRARVAPDRARGAGARRAGAGGAEGRGAKADRGLATGARFQGSSSRSTSSTARALLRRPGSRRRRTLRSSAACRPWAIPECTGIPGFGSPVGNVGLRVRLGRAGLETRRADWPDDPAAGCPSPPLRARKKSRSCCKTWAAAARRVGLRDQTAGRTTPLNTKIPSSAVIAADAMVVNVSSDTARLSSRGSFRTYSAAEDRCPARGSDIPVGRACRVSGRPHAVEWCPVRSLRTPRTGSHDSRRAEGALAQQQDPQLAFREQFTPW
jgi:hypothetical protein